MSPGSATSPAHAITCGVRAEQHLPLGLEPVGVGEDRAVTEVGAVTQVGGAGDRVGDHPSPEGDHLR